MGGLAAGVNLRTLAGPSSKCRYANSNQSGSAGAITFEHGCKDLCVYSVAGRYVRGSNVTVCLFNGLNCRDERMRPQKSNAVMRPEVPGRRSGQWRVVVFKQLESGFMSQ